MPLGAKLSVLLGFCLLLAACISTREAAPMQTCWDGSTIPAAETCSPQLVPPDNPPPSTKTCPDGSVIPESLDCPVVPRRCPGPDCPNIDPTVPITPVTAETVERSRPRSAEAPRGDVTSCPYGTEADCVAVDAYIAGRRWIRTYIAYQRTVNVDDEFILRVTVDPHARQSDAELTVGLTNGTVARGRVREARVLVPAIAASSAIFEITPQFSSAEQQLDGDTPIEWAWRVKARRSSDALQRITVHLNTYIYVRGRRGAAREVGDPLIAEVQILTPVPRKMRSWLLSMAEDYKILAPLVGGGVAVFAWLRRFRKSKTSTPRNGRRAASKKPT